MLTVIITIVGLLVLEVVQSIDNAIVNAHMLRTMSVRARRWFLVWGVFTAVFLVRGVLPLLIVRLTVPGLSLWEAALATFGGDPTARQAMDAHAYVLLIGGGMFLTLLYFHWLFLEKKDPYFVFDRLVKERHGIWFFAIAASLLVGLLWATRDKPAAMIAAAVGNAVFFILYGLRRTAEQEEHAVETGRNDLAKLLFLEVLDLSFSIDGVLGSFAFTTNVLLIMVGNGLGALIVRDLTVRGMEQVGKYRWIKNGAMTSIGALGVFMILDALGVPVPQWLPTVTTLAIVGLTFRASHLHLRAEEHREHAAELERKGPHDIL